MARITLTIELADGRKSISVVESIIELQNKMNQARKLEHPTIRFHERNGGRVASLPTNIVGYMEED